MENQKALGISRGIKIDWLLGNENKFVSQVSKILSETTSKIDTIKKHQIYSPYVFHYLETGEWFIVYCNVGSDMIYINKDIINKSLKECYKLVLSKLLKKNFKEILALDNLGLLEHLYDIRRPWLNKITITKLATVYKRYNIIK